MGVREGEVLILTVETNTWSYVGHHEPTREPLAEHPWWVHRSPRARLCAKESSDRLPMEFTTDPLITSTCIGGVVETVAKQECCPILVVHAI